MAQLNNSQINIINFIENRHLSCLNRLAGLYEESSFSDVKILFDNLPAAILGNQQAVQLIKDQLHRLEELSQRICFALPDKNALDSFLKLLKEFIEVASKKPAALPRLTGYQQAAIECLMDKTFIDFIWQYQEVYKDREETMLLSKIKETAQGIDNSKQLFDSIYFVDYGVRNAKVSSEYQGKNKSLCEFLYQLRGKFLKPSFIERCTGMFLGIFTGAILKPLAHNPIYHFLQLFRSKKPKFHFTLIFIFFGAPFYLLWKDGKNGADNGIWSITYDLKYLAGRHHLDLTIVSLLIISAATAAALLTLLFPPVIPLLITNIPLLVTFTPAVLAIIVGAVTGVFLTTLTAMSLLIHTCFKVKPSKCKSARAVTFDLVTPISEADKTRAAALGKREEYQAIYTTKADAGKNSGDSATITTPVPEFTYSLQ